MVNYSISTLEKLSGIKAHTIRIWEQRYKVLTPLRTDTNIRCYDDSQLKKLLNIVTLMHNGFRISKIAQMSVDELNAKVTNLVENPIKNDEGSIQALTNQLISKGMSLDLPGFESVFQSIRKEYSTEDAYLKILQPMMIKIGLLWTKNKINPAQEHFLSNLVRQKLLSATDILPLPKNETKRWLLFLPPDEYHEIGLLYAQFLLRKYNNHVLYLGANVPVKDIEEVAKMYKPTHSLFFLIKNMTLRNGQKYVDQIYEAMPNAQVLVAGNNIFLDKLTLHKDLIRLKDPETFMTKYILGNV